MHLREAPAVDDRLVFVFVHDYDGRTDKLHQLRTLVEEGRLTPRAGPVFRPEQAAEAHRRLEAGGTRGRIILEF